ncbi:MAG: T9SS type A sorting domain-containing protein, partial [bacterium]
VKTTDGGEHWIKVESGMQGDGRYTCVYFLNENTGWIGNFDSPDYGVRKTTNGGSTIFSNSFLGFPEDIYFKDSLNGIGVGGVAQIFKTSNGGQNWSIDFLAGSGDFYRVSFINLFTGYTASSKAVYKTTNFGISWDSVGHIPAIVISLSFDDAKTGYAGTAYSILKTIDSGKTWTSQIPTGVIYDLFSENDSVVWGCGNGGRIWHTDNGGISSVVNISNVIPERFQLDQNYPNPFNSQTKLSFSIIQPGFYSLEIYNNLGQKITEIFNQNFSAGNYITSLDASDLNSGIYFYKLSGNNLSLTKKLLLIK